MQNQSSAVDRRLDDPETEGWLVRRLIALVLFLVVLLSGFAGHDVYVWTHPPGPVYIPFGKGITAQQVEGLANPVLDESEMLDWTVKWLLATFSLNYHDYPSQMSEVGKHYTTAGWKSLSTTYIKSGDFEAMRAKLLTCYANPERSAVIKRSPVIDGRRTYEVQLRILKTCENVDIHNRESLTLTAIVVRVADFDHPDGLAIDNVVGRVM